MLLLSDDIIRKVAVLSLSSCPCLPDNKTLFDVLDLLSQEQEECSDIDTHTHTHTHRTHTHRTHTHRTQRDETGSQDINSVRSDIQPHRG